MDVADVMTRDVVSLAPETSIRAAARLMVDRHISGLPVMDHGRVVGVISEADFVTRDGTQTWVSRVLFRDDDGPLHGLETVAELMSPSPVTIADTATVQEAARLMTRKGVKRLPVLDHKGNMVGIVTRSDLIRAYVRADTDVATEARELISVLPAPLSGVNIDVVDGVALLTGEVDSSLEARAVARIIKGVEGVVRVDSHLTWEMTPEHDESPWSAYPQEGAEV